MVASSIYASGASLGCGFATLIAGGDRVGEGDPPVLPLLGGAGSRRTGFVGYCTASAMGRRHARGARGRGDPGPAGRVWAERFADPGSLGAAVVQAPSFCGGVLVPKHGFGAWRPYVAIVVPNTVGGAHAAMVQSLAPTRMRRLLAALYGVCVNVAGLGLRRC